MIVTYLCGAIAVLCYLQGVGAFARNGHADGLLALGCALALALFCGPGGLLLALALAAPLWLLFPKDFPRAYWPHVYVPIVLPALLFILADCLLLLVFSEGILPMATEVEYVLWSGSRMVFAFAVAVPMCLLLRSRGGRSLDQLLVVATAATMLLAGASPIEHRFSPELLAVVLLATATAILAVTYSWSRQR